MIEPILSKVMVVIFIISMGSPIQAQIENIITDRPDQTESAALVPKGYFQGEHGISVNFQDDLNEYSIASTLLRFGINDIFEFRLEVDPVLIDGVENISGIKPLGLGMKSKLIQRDLFSLSLITHIYFPKLATDDFQTNFTSLSTRLTAAHQIHEKWSIGYNAGLEWDGFIPSPKMIYTFTTGFSFANNWGWFAEIFGEIQCEPLSETDINYNRSSHYFDTGFSYQINENFQIDISSGADIKNIKNDYFISTGFAYRFNTIKSK